jgi:hypothetical protein
MRDTASLYATGAVVKPQKECGSALSYQMVGEA